MDPGRAGRACRGYAAHISVFCRHNRHTAECPICSKGTPLDPARAPERPRRRGSGGKQGKAPAQVAKGPYSVVGPYEDDGTGYEVRLERVPGGLRLAEWTAGSIRRRAPVLGAGDLAGLIGDAVGEGILEEGEAARLGPVLSGSAPGEEPGVSPGRAGELRDELRVERIDEDHVRVGRWVMRPNFGWELQETPVMLPPGRYVEAIASAVS